MNFVWLIVSFLVLVFSRQTLINLLARLAGRKFFRTAYFILFLPGIIIHELAHFLIANLLFVPTGQISLFPEEEKMASIQVAKTGPVRQALIGFAPPVIGTGIILTVFLLPLNLPLRLVTIPKFISLFKEGKNLIWFYLVFAINNTMFISETDRRSWLGLLVLLTLVFSSLYLFGLLPLISGPLNYYASLTADLIIKAYGLTFLLNLIFIVPLFVFQRLLKKL